MKNPKVSIIIPVYNGSNYLREAIESALAQTYPNFEVLVINDGSNDHGKTERIAKSFGKKIRYFKKPNGGVSTALNLGLKKMTGVYFSWLSHDDLYFPDKLKKEVAFIQKCPSKTLVYCNFEVIDPTGAHLAETQIKPMRPAELMPALMKSRFINGCALLIARSAFEDVGNFNIAMFNTQDFDLWFRFIKKGYILKLCPGILMKSRHHPRQTSITTSDKQVIEEDALYLNVLKDFKPRQLILAPESLCLGYLNIAFGFKALGFQNTSAYAVKLSRQYLTGRDFMIWLFRRVYYALWSKPFAAGINFTVRVGHKIKKIYLELNQKMSSQ